MPGEDRCRVLFRPQQFANHIIGIRLTPLRSDHARELRPSGFLHDSEACLEAETTLETQHGRIAVRWQLVDGVLTVDAELPDGVDGRTASTAFSVYRDRMTAPSPTESSSSPFHSPRR